MTQTTLIRHRGKLYAYSFTTGTKLIEPKVRMTDDTILAECMCLAKRGKVEEAEELLNWYCSWRYPQR